MQVEKVFGLGHFIAQSDTVGLTLFIVLLSMSVLSWTVILKKSRQAFLWQKSFRVFMQKLDCTTSDIELKMEIPDSKTRHAAAELLHRGLKAPATFRDAALAHAIDDEASRMESGQTCLASIASSAPFIGLFGTVWGIYHALVSIAASGQSSLDQVAGPVGEALIMTALGLVVAIPAALAYNAFQRLMRTQLACLDRFAHEFSMRLGSHDDFQGK